jgi:hypothetical protein
MKKILSVLFIIITSFVTLFGCSCDDNNEYDNRANLSVGDFSYTTYEIIEMDTLKGKTSAKDDFILFVYQDGCYACSAFKPVLESVIQSLHIKVYALNYWNIEKGHELKELKYTPSIVVYKEGKAILKTDPTLNSEYFANKDGFIKLLDQYTITPKAYYLSLSQLDLKISNRENFIVYFSRNSCSDCSYLNNNYLKEVILSLPKDKNFYILETDVEGIRLTNGTPDSEKWQQFKDNYGLSKANNPLGHGVGYVPTFQYYEGGQIKDMAVYFNDFSSVVTENGVAMVTIDMSYYNDHPYINQKIAYSEYKNLVAPYYNSKIRQFFDDHLKSLD